MPKNYTKTISKYTQRNKDRKEVSPKEKRTLAVKGEARSDTSILHSTSSQPMKSQARPNRLMAPSKEGQEWTWLNGCQSGRDCFC
jgi:hypothetical protein